MKKIKKAIAYEFMWVDAITSSGWQYNDTLDCKKASECVTVGFIVHEDKGNITIASTIAGDSADNTSNCRITIPKTWLIKRKKIKAIQLGE